MYYSCLPKRLKQSLLTFGLSYVLTGLEWHPGFEDNYGTTNDGIVDDLRRFVCEMIAGASGRRKSPTETKDLNTCAPHHHFSLRNGLIRKK